MNGIKRRLKQLRLTRGLTMAEFAQQIDVSPGNVGDWESESRGSVPGAKALIAISQAFDVSPDWILLGDGDGDGEDAPAASTVPPYPKWEKNSHSAAMAEKGDEDTVQSIMSIVPKLSAEDKRLLLDIATRLQGDAVRAL